MKFLKRTLIVILSLLLLWIIAGCILIFYIVPKTDIKSIAEESVNETINAKSSFSDIDVAVFSTFPYVSLVINDFTLRDSLTYDTLIYAKQIRFNLSTPQLLEKKIEFHNIVLAQPYVKFSIDSLGKNNLSNLIKKRSKGVEGKTALTFNKISLQDGNIDYDNKTTGKTLSVKNIFFDFQGKINLQDTVLDIRHGHLYVGKNTLDFRGNLDPHNIDITASHSFGNIDKFLELISMNETKVKGLFTGKWHIYGELNDSLHGICLEVQENAKNISCISSKNEPILSGGDIAFESKYVIGEPDSSYLSVTNVKLDGKFIAVEGNGVVTYKNDDIFINAKAKANGNLTELVNRTSLLSKGKTLKGNFKADLAVSSSLSDLKHKYRFPKSMQKIYDLDFKIRMPNISGMVNIDGLKFHNDTINCSADKVDLNFNGEETRLFAQVNEFQMTRDGKIENTAAKIKKGEISIDGRKNSGTINIWEAGLVDITGTNDSVTAVAHRIDLNLGGNGKNKVADALLESFTVNKGETRLFGAKVTGQIFKSSKTSKKPWDACELEAYITRFENRNLDLFCKRITSTFNYDGKLSGLNTLADSINVKSGENELRIKDVTIASKGNGKYNVLAKTADADKNVLGMTVKVEKLDGTYDIDKKLINLKTERVLAGESDFVAAGTVDLTDTKGNPKVNFNLSGKYLNINQMMVASNRFGLAKGNPNAIPLDSIPEGKIPRSGGKDGKNMTLSLNLKRMTLTSIELYNVTGNIYMRGKSTLLDNIRSYDSGYSLCLSSKYTFINRNFSTTEIILDIDNIKMSDFPQLLPSFKNITPMQSALKGTIDINLVIKTPVRKFLGIDLHEGKATLALEAKDLSITDNEKFSKVAKTLKFKNRQSTKVDSLFAAATIENAQLKIYPCHLEIDRYKVALFGESDLITEQINYHIAVLKSPIPFKFGIDITGLPEYKIKLSQSGYKQLKPNLKPKDYPEFKQFNASLKKPIIDFKNSIK